MENLHTVIIGGGQAGLATSYYLKQRGIEHIILEQGDQPAHVWRDERWDSFALNTPNWTVQLPGAVYESDDPEGFASREELVRYFDEYVKKFALPVRCGVRVTSVEPQEGGGWLVRAGEETIRAVNVVVATGLFQAPKVPTFAEDLSPRITQLHSSRYRNPADLPDGGVLVAGAGQSGCQIVEDLLRAGRKVYFSVGNAGRAPRRYRGRDIFSWLNAVGFFDRTPDMLPSSRARFGANPQVAARKIGPPLNLHRLAREGVKLLGRLTGGGGERITLAPDLHESLEKADKFEADLLKRIDDLIAAKAIEAPEEALPEYWDGFDVEVVTELDLAASGINTIIWAQGYAFDYSMVKAPVTDADGFPVQQRGVTEHPGLYFVGMPWLYKFKSGLLLGVGEDAEYIAAHIAGR